MIRKLTLAAGLTLALATPAMGQGDDLVDTKRMGMGLAKDIAKTAVTTCREKGYQVTAAVVDRSGQLQALLRDVYAPAVSVGIAQEKAATAAMFSVPSGELPEDAAASLNHVDTVLALTGGLPIEAGGSLVGGVGVSGAPDSRIDEECAQAGLDAVSDRLQFGGL